MAKHEMVLFTKDRLNKVLGVLDIKTDEKDGREIVLNPENEEEQAVCVACESKIDVENLGHIAKGSKKIYCKNPACFSHFIAEKKLWE